jgi:hypothetical protein
VPRTPLPIDVAKLRTAAHRLFVVNGSADAMAYCDMPSVDTIDRQLSITFDLPELSVKADGSSPFNETCGRSWSCGCLRYEVCPGMELTTAMTRDFATIADTTGGPPNFTVRTLDRLGVSQCTFHADAAICGADARVRLGRDLGQDILVGVR